MGSENFTKIIFYRYILYKAFLEFFCTCHFSVDVCIFLNTHFDKSLVSISCYGYKIYHHKQVVKPFLIKKCMFFPASCWLLPLLHFFIVTAYPISNVAQFLPFYQSCFPPPWESTNPPHPLFSHLSPFLSRFLCPVSLHSKLILKHTLPAQ